LLIVVTLFGIMIEVIAVYSNACLSIEVTRLPIVTVDKEVQPSNRFDAIDVRPLPIETDFNNLHSENALESKVVTLSGIIRVVIAVPLKALDPMKVTLAGIVKVVNLVSAKAPSPMEVTFLLRVTDERKADLVKA
jgi:hypothetical protein